MVKKAVVYKPIGTAINDKYQTSVSTNYVRDQITGELFKTSGLNVRTIIPEMFRSAKFVGDFGDASASSDVFYTVPAGKVFIVLQVAATSSCEANSFGNNTHLYVTYNGTDFHLSGGYGTTAGGIFAHSINTASILVCDEGDSFKVSTSNAKVKIWASVCGYEIDKSEYLGTFN